MKIVALLAILVAVWSRGACGDKAQLKEAVVSLLNDSVQNELCNASQAAVTGNSFPSKSFTMSGTVTSSSGQATSVVSNQVVTPNTCVLLDLSNTPMALSVNAVMGNYNGMYSFVATYIPSTGGVGTRTLNANIDTATVSFENNGATLALSISPTGSGATLSASLFSVLALVLAIAQLF